MKQFTVHDDFDLYKKNTFDIEKGLTCLIGPNGTGKSTLLRCIKRQLDKENIPCFTYDNYKEGGSNAKAKYGSQGQAELLAEAFCSSEGQQIMLNYGQTLAQIGSFVRSNLKKGNKEMFILLDALDSGLSINNIREVKDIFKLILGEDKEALVYIIVAANSYELVIGTECIDVRNARHRRFRDYVSYASTICSK